MLKAFVWLHRWLGIVLCLFFAIWFASGAVLLFVPFPSLSPQEAGAHGCVIPMDQVAKSPAAAARAVRGATGLKLICVSGAPVYIVSSGVGDRGVSGRTGRPLIALTKAEAGRVASDFGAAPVRAITGPLQYDQWVVHQAFDHARPLYRVSLSDPQGTELYVAANTGEVVQETRFTERAWNWVGAVVHWLYFVPIRQTFMIWDQTVWWIALVGVVMTVVGVGLGVYRTTKKMQSKRPAFSPFKGWLKWHHILGICASLFVFTWILSGWLSMDHGRLFSRGESPEHGAIRYTGAPLNQLLPQTSVEAMRRLPPTRRLAFNGLGGRLLVSARSSSASPAVIIGAGGPGGRAPVASILAALHAGWPDAAVAGPLTATAGDFYAKAEGVEPGSDVYRLTGGVDATVYVDPSSGRILAFVSKSRAAYDWVYYGLHTFNFPYLLESPLLRDLLVLPLLALGFALCVTSVVVGVRRLRIVSAPQ